MKMWWVLCIEWLNHLRMLKIWKRLILTILKLDYSKHKNTRTEMNINIPRFIYVSEVLIFLCFKIAAIVMYPHWIPKKFLRNNAMSVPHFCMLAAVSEYWWWSFWTLSLRSNLYTNKLINLFVWTAVHTFW